MYGIQKGTVNLNLLNNDTNEFDNVGLLTNVTDDPGALNAIYANPGKMFQTVQVRFDAAVTSANVVTVVQDRINEWVAANGKRYDDIVVTINPSGANHDIMTLITRNY